MIADRLKRILNSRRFKAICGVTFVLCAALVIVVATEPMRYRSDWVRRSHEYVQDLFDAQLEAVHCRFTERTRIALACEIDLDPNQLAQLSRLEAPGSSPLPPCAMTKSDPCSKISGYCSSAERPQAGIDVYDTNSAQNRSVVAAHKDKIPYQVMLGNLYLDRAHSKACLVITTGGSDQMTC